MSDPVLSTFPRLGEPIGKTADGQDVLLSESFQRLLEQLFLRTGGNNDSVVQANNVANGIRFGTVPLTDVIIDGRGSLSEQLESLATNTQAARNEAAEDDVDPANNKLTVSVSPSSAYGQGEDATIFTNAVTLTAAGGTAPYTITYTRQTGATFDVENPTAFTTRFSTDASSTVTSTYCATVTDSAASPATAEVCFAVSVYRPNPDENLG